MIQQSFDAFLPASLPPQITETQLKNMFLQQRQSLPLSVKIRMFERRVIAWYDRWQGNVHVSFSGGRDSTFLLFLVRQIYPHIKAVFVDTGTEFPEIREFVRSVPNVTWIKPKYTYKECLEKWGYLVVSKKVSMSINRYRTTKSDVQKALRLAPGINPTSGRWQTKGVIPKKYHYLIDAPFKISDYCCNALKHQPQERYERLTDSKAFVGTMACDSKPRKDEVIKHGCNVFDSGRPTSRPMSFFTREDIKELGLTIPHCCIYDHYDSTGCMLCASGVQEEMRKTGTNRYLILQKTHPKIHRLAIPAFGLDKVLDYMKIPWRE
jgi:3'-phosphoadenosine 5'-phosphosulfate sulfotransferase (PAPS reductase)/FAD synthetase